MFYILGSDSSLFHGKSLNTCTLTQSVIILLCSSYILPMYRNLVEEIIFVAAISEGI